MRVLCVLLLAGLLVAQDGPPVAVVRGELVVWNPAGRFEIAARDREIYPCAFDEDTYLSGSSGRISASDVRVGQRVEAVVDRRGEPGSCKALTVYVLMASRALRQAALRPDMKRSRQPLPMPCSLVMIGPFPIIGIWHLSCNMGLPLMRYF